MIWLALISGIAIGVAILPAIVIYQDGWPDV